MLLMVFSIYLKRIVPVVKLFISRMLLDRIEMYINFYVASIKLMPPKTRTCFCLANTTKKVSNLKP